MCDSELQQHGLAQIFDEQKLHQRMELGQVVGEVGFAAGKDLIAYLRDQAEAKALAAQQTMLGARNSFPSSSEQDYNSCHIKATVKSRNVQRNEAERIGLDGFPAFQMERAADLLRIARHTRGEHSVDDVVSEAWLLAATWPSLHDASLNLLCRSDQDLLISHLYQQLVRYTELNVRHAVRLDHAPDDAEGSHPLLGVLCSAEQEPLSALISEEEVVNLPSECDLMYSIASSYLMMLEHCQFRISSLARFLRLSTSQTYRCCARARVISAWQHALVLAPPLSMAVLRPWRRYRAERKPVQLEFDFEDRLALHFI